MSGKEIAVLIALTAQYLIILVLSLSIANLNNELAEIKKTGVIVEKHYQRDVGTEVIEKTVYIEEDDDDDDDEESPSSKIVPVPVPINTGTPNNLTSNGFTSSKPLQQTQTQQTVVNKPTTVKPVTQIKEEKQSVNRNLLNKTSSVEVKPTTISKGVSTTNIKPSTQTVYKPIEKKVNPVETKQTQVKKQEVIESKPKPVYTPVTSKPSPVSRPHSKSR